MRAPRPSKCRRPGEEACEGRGRDQHRTRGTAARPRVSEGDYSNLEGDKGANSRCQQTEQEAHGP